jgi:hypothetical protein
MGAFPSENVFKIMQFSPKSNCTSGFFIPLQGKNPAIFPKITDLGPLPLAVKKSPAWGNHVTAWMCRLIWIYLLICWK